MSEENNKLFTLTGDNGERDVFAEDLDENTKPLANDLQLAIALKNARADKAQEAMLEIQTNQIIDAFINIQAANLDSKLPPKVEVVENKKEKK